MSEESSLDLMVYYTWGIGSKGPKYDPDFHRVIDWDIPLLNGYKYMFCENIAKKPGSNHFFGIITPNLVQDITNWEPDVVWVWGWSFYSHLKVLRNFKGKKSIWFRGDSTLLDEAETLSIYKIARRLFLTWVYRHVDKVFYVGTHNKNYYTAHGLKPFQMVYGPHAIENERFAEEKDEYQTQLGILRRKLNIEDTDTVFLFAGKLESKKNPFFILQLAKLLIGNQYKFIIVGNGVLENQLKKASFGDSRVSYVDFQNQSVMPILYRLASYFVLPSVGPGETWGLSINEALASGTPVIVSDKCGGAIDLINSSNGYVLNFQQFNFKDFETWLLNFNLDEMRNQNKFFIHHFCYQNLIKQVIKNIQ